jgi:hypothetical protein
VQVLPTGDAWLIGDHAPVAGSSVSRGAAWYFDGTSWSGELVASTDLRGLAQTPELGVVAVGGDGGIVSLVAAPAPHIVDLRTGPAVQLRSTFGSSPTDMWAVGDQGTVLHYDGERTSSIPSQTTANLTDVWGTGPSDVWAVGAGGTVLHYDGRVFTPVPSGTSADLLAVFTAAPDDVWLGAGGGVLQHRVSGQFQPATVPGIAGMAVRDLHGLASNDVWLAGGTLGVFDPSTERGFVSHFDGTAWSPALTLTVPPSDSQSLARIWELAPNDVWGLTDNSGFPTRTWHFDGATWTSGLAGQGQDPAAFMFPIGSGIGTFVFGPHDRWRVGELGTWERSVQ